MILIVTGKCYRLRIKITMITQACEIIFIFFSAPLWVSLMFFDMPSSEMPSFSLYHVRFLHKVSMKIQENHIEDIAESKNLIYKNLKISCILHFY